MYNDSFPGPEICESGQRESMAVSGPLVAPPFIGISGGCATKRKLEGEQTCVWRFANEGFAEARPAKIDVWMVPA
jgi:hypothetical protein